MPVHTKILPQRGSEIGVWKIDEEEEFFTKIKGLERPEGLEKIKVPKKRLEWLAVRAMLRDQDISEDIFYDEKGKPRLENKNISISHCFPLVAIYCCNKPLVPGIDVEKINDRVLKIANRFVAAEETTAIRIENIFDLTLAWAAKEAVFKKYGGDTVHFKNNIRIKKVDAAGRKIKVGAVNAGIEATEELVYHLIDDFIIAYTQ